jgi:hypothetical protein
VVLAVSDRSGGDAKLTTASVQARRLGYHPSQGGDLACNRGLREGLRLRPDKDYWVSQVFFATRDQAAQFVAAYPPGVVGTVQVRTYCRD